MADPDNGRHPGDNHAPNRNGQPPPPPIIAPASSSSLPPPPRSSAATLAPDLLSMAPDGTRNPMRNTLPPPLPSALAASNVPPLHITVRFLSLPDIQLDIAHPDRVTVAGMKPMVRAQLVLAAKNAIAESSSLSSSSSTPSIPSTPSKAPAPPSSSSSSSSSPSLADAHKRTLRFYYGGKRLFDHSILSAAIRPVAPPPRNLSGSPASSNDGTSSHHRAAHAPPVPRVYVSCSLGDLMTERDLLAEVVRGASASAASDTGWGGSGIGRGAAWRMAAAAPPSGDRFSSAVVGGGGGSGGSENASLLRSDRRGGGGGGGGGASGSGPPGSSSAAAAHAPSTMPVPRGFERLLQTGFTAAEVNQLRLQFRSIQESRFTPDNLPSPDTLRTMEENWLDNNQGGGMGGGGTGPENGGGGAGMMDTLDGTGGAGGAPGDDEFGLPGLMDIMVRGMLIGFLFPLGSAGWLSREEGLWTRKWQVFVSFGVVLSLTIGTIKTLAGE